MISDDNLALKDDSGRNDDGVVTIEAPHLVPSRPTRAYRYAAERKEGGATFDLKTWSGSGGASYTISVEAGNVHTNRSEATPY